MIVNNIRYLEQLKRRICSTFSSMKFALFYVWQIQIPKRGGSVDSLIKVLYNANTSLTTIFFIFYLIWEAEILFIIFIVSLTIFSTSSQLKIYPWKKLYPKICRSSALAMLIIVYQWIVRSQVRMAQSTVHYLAAIRRQNRVVALTRLQLLRYRVRSIRFPGSTPVCGGFFSPGRTCADNFLILCQCPCLRPI